MNRYSTRALLLFVGAIALSATTAHAQIQVTAPEVGCEAGQSIAATVNVSSLTGQGISGYDFELAFDNTIARVSAATNSNTLSAGMTFIANPKETALKVAAASANPLSGSGALVNLTVQCLIDGVSPLTFESFRFNAGSPVAALVNGSVGVAAAIPSAEVSVSDLNLGDVILGRETDATFSITNSGTGQLTGSVQIIGDDADAFELRGTDGTISLLSGQKLDLTVALVATAVGEKNAQLEITHDAANIESPILINLSGEVLLNVGTEVEGELPTDYRLAQNFPNPFNPQTSVTFGLPATGSVRISLFDLNGREVQVLADDTFSAGWHTLEVNATSLPSGTYIYRLQADGHSVARKMTVLK